MAGTGSPFIMSPKCTPSISYHARSRNHEKGRILVGNAHSQSSLMISELGINSENSTQQSSAQWKPLVHGSLVTVEAYPRAVVYTRLYPCKVCQIMVMVVCFASKARVTI